MRKVRYKDWAKQLHEITQCLKGHKVIVELLEESLEAAPITSTKLKCLTYNSKEKMIEIISKNNQIYISEPAAFYITYEDKKSEYIKSIEFVDGENKVHILIFREPLALQKLPLFDRKVSSIQIRKHNI